MFLSRLYLVIVIHSWWVIAFIIGCTIIYEQGVKNQNLLYLQLTQQHFSLQKEKQETLLHQKKMQLQINSQGDMSWVELALIKELGLVPDGQQKIYFFPDNL